MEVKTRSLQRRKVPRLSQTTQTMTWRGLGGRNRGVALLFTLSVGTLLIVLAVSLLTMYSSDAHSQSQLQQGVQAYWNARAGVERYTDSRQVPASSVYDFGASGRCSVLKNGPDLLFEGHYGKQHRRILLVAGDPARKVEEPHP